MYSEFRYVTTKLYQSGSTPNPIISELPFTDVNFTSQLNSIGTFQGHVLLSGINAGPSNVYDGTIPGKTILWVLYSDPESLVSIPVWSGVIWQREYNSTSQTLQITAQEMMSLYQKRRISVDQTYVAQNPAQIAKDVMVYAEGKTHGKTGLTYATVPVASPPLSTNRAFVGNEYKPVFQAVKELSENYFDFKIQPFNTGGVLTNQFKMGIPLGVEYSTSSLVATVLQLPGNIIEYNFPEDATGATNTLYGVGYKVDGTRVIATAIDPDKITTGDWPLLEDYVSYVDVGDVDLLKDLTLGQLNATSYPPTTMEVILAPYNDPYYPSYSIGDQVRIDIKDDYFPSGLNGLIMRIVGISVSPGENGPSRVTLTLTRLLAAGTVS